MREYNALSDSNKALARHAGRALNNFFDERARDPKAKPPADLRLKPVRKAKGVFEVTWSFSRPDGRMTFNLVKNRSTGEQMVWWRRCGGHDIFHDP